MFELVTTICLRLCYAQKRYIAKPLIRFLANFDSFGMLKWQTENDLGRLTHYGLHALTNKLSEALREGHCVPRQHYFVHRS